MTRTQEGQGEGGTDGRNVRRSVLRKNISSGRHYRRGGDIYQTPRAVRERESDLFRGNGIAISRFSVLNDNPDAARRRVGGRGFETNGNIMVMYRGTINYRLATYTRSLARSLALSTRDSRVASLSVFFFLRVLSVFRRPLGRHTPPTKLRSGVVVAFRVPW